MGTTLDTLNEFIETEVLGENDAIMNIPDVSAGYAPLFIQDMARQYRIVEAGFTATARHLLVIRRVLFPHEINEETGVITSDYNFTLAEKRINLLTGENGDFAPLCDGQIIKNVAVPSLYGYRKSIPAPVVDTYKALVNAAYTRHIARIETVRAIQANFSETSVYTVHRGFNRLTMNPFDKIMAAYRAEFATTK